jgi:uncharacterized protein YdaL
MLNTLLKLRRGISRVLRVLIPVLLSASGAVHAAAPAAPDVIIIHDSLPGPLPSGAVVGYNIVDLLGHFNLKGSLVSMEEYKAGEIGRSRFAIFLGVDDRVSKIPAPLLTDLRNTKAPLMWISRHAQEFLADPAVVSRLGFRVGNGVLAGFQSVTLNGISLIKSKDDPFMHPIELVDNSKVQVVATAQSKDGQSRPYVVRSGSFWYFADSPFSYAEEGDRYLAFCELLHDFFGIAHQQEQKALLRIEDVSAETDPDQLRSIADYLAVRRIPFQVSIIPIFRDPEDNNAEIYLSDRPQFVRALKYMVSKGATIVMHGVTHQYRGRSGDDYEFWDDLSGKPVTSDSRHLVEQKLRLGLEECFKNGIYPLTWETPHYVASDVDYQSFARYFNSSYDRVPSVNNAESGHFFPYPTTDRYGRFIIPECLGYVAIEKPDPDQLVANAARLRVVRDGVASFFFHPFMDRQYLEKILDGIEGLGYRFISIRDYDCRLQMDERLVQSYTENVQLRLHGHYLHRLLVHSDGHISGESYSNKPLDTVVKDPGVVPPDAILVMEGITDIVPQKEPPVPSWWETAAKWIRSRMPKKAQEPTVQAQPDAVVLWDDTLARGDWNNQKSYASALSAFGFDVAQRNWKDFGRDALDPGVVLVVPHAGAAKLSKSQLQLIVDFVRDGGHLVLDGPSLLSDALAIRNEKRSVRVRTAQDLLNGNAQYKTRDSTWNPGADVVRFQVPDPVSVYAQDKDSEIPLAVVGRLGRGNYLYLGARLDPVTPLGYSRFPYFVHYILAAFSIKLPLQRAQLELYFDPGLSNENIDRLAEEWRKLGVRAVYAAAYQFWPKWSYNYNHLIEVCHKNGILIYAWFELPHVSTKFWDEHPEWRAKTATGADGIVGWRYHMDLDIPECQDAAFDFVEELTRKYAWDGVNIAELNYDTEGPANPAKYIPMGKSTRSAFRALGGFDPVELFREGSPYFWKQNAGALKKFEEYRSQRVVAWHRSLLERLTPVARERDIEIIVTMLDSLHSNTLTRDTGVDSRRILALMDTFPFTLQVEDPAQFWADSPDRYLKFGETYSALVRDRRRLMFDINIVPNRDIEHSHSPTPTLTGVELAQSLLAATKASGRAALYSEGTLPFEDLQVLSRVLAHDARVDRRWNGWVTDSPRSVLLTTPGQWQDFRVDDHIWPGWGENEVVIPGGSHRITAAERKFRLLDTSVLDIRLLHFSGNLDELAPTGRGIEFKYNSYLRTMALFNRQPFQVLVDGQLWNEPPVSYSGHWSVRLPRGEHKVEVLADSTAYVILDTTSLYSSSLIVIFGSVACGIMLLLYMSILVRRAFSRAVQSKAR